MITNTVAALNGLYSRARIVENDKDCIFSPDDIDKLPVSNDPPIVTKDGATAINLHEIAFITGTEAARTAIFAKMIAATALCGGEYPFANDMKTSFHDARVLWVDGISTPQAMVQLAKDMKQQFNANRDNFRIIALTALGDDQVLVGHIYPLICDTVTEFKPNLIVINDLDYVFTNAIWRDASAFVEFLRDYVNYNEAAVCAVGHNLIGKVKRTTGYVGEIMFPLASTVYRVAERSKKQCEVTRVLCYKSMMQCPRDFAFIINEHNFPQQVDTPTSPQSASRFLYAMATDTPLQPSDPLCSDTVATNAQQPADNQTENKNQHQVLTVF